MRFIEALTEHDMVATFLQTELRSERFGAMLVRLLDRDGMPHSVVERPDPRDKLANAYRLQLFHEFRGYPNSHLFEHFPTDAMWQRAEIDRDELVRVKYIKYDYWIELSGGTRLPLDAARNIRNGLVVFDQDNKAFLRAAEALRRGAVFPPLILVSTDERSDMVVLEGHLRLTAYCLALDATPPTLNVIVGLSPAFVRWDDF